MRWQDRAACRGEDPELFFPSTTSGPDHERQVSAAKAVCGSCPVRLPCLQHALRRQLTDGIWGGTTEVERRRITLSRGFARSRAPA